MPTSASAAPLRLEPFRAVTYADPARLGEVTCPPYDVIGPGAVAGFEAADRHNIVRLILPRPGEHQDRYHHAAAELETWLASGVLVRDAEPALYVYELSTAAASAVGLVGAISLGSRILPHEDTFAAPVADRVALMTTTRSQLEPILLTYRGNGAASDLVDAARLTEPAIEASTADGQRHRIWRLDAPAALASVASDLAGREALIADGHHRFAAYRQVADAPDAGAAAQSGLAMLVDADRHPLELRAVHRAVGGLDLEAAVEASAGAFAVRRLARTSGWSGWSGALADAADRGITGFVVSDAVDAVMVHLAAGSAVAAGMPRDRSSTWRGLDAAVLKHGLLGDAWGVDDAGSRVTYHHDPLAAIDEARRSGGVAVLANPPHLDDVVNLAARGERMPQKSTSFGPKPRTGLLMRLIDC